MKRTWETRFGLRLFAGMMILASVVTIHIWQDSLSEDQAWIWSCRTMGDRHCRDGEPLVKIHISNLWQAGQPDPNG